MKTENTFLINFKSKGIICFSCRIPEHKAFKCRKNKGRKFCNFCNSSSQDDKTCRKSKDKAKTVDDVQHSFAFQVKEKDFYPPCDESFLVNYGATTRIINYDRDHIFIDYNTNPEGHFIELADGTKSSKIVKKRNTVVISLRTKESNLVKTTLENTCLSRPSLSVFFPYKLQLKKGPKEK